MPNPLYLILFGEETTLEELYTKNHEGEIISQAGRVLVPQKRCTFMDSNWVMNCMFRQSLYKRSWSTLRKSSPSKSGSIITILKELFRRGKDACGVRQVPAPRTRVLHGLESEDKELLYSCNPRGMKDVRNNRFVRLWIHKYKKLDTISISNSYITISRTSMKRIIKRSRYWRNIIIIIIKINDEV